MRNETLLRRITTGCLGMSLAVSVPSCGRNGAAGTNSPELPQPSRELELPDEAFVKVFDNGLTLFVLPDAYTRLVQFDVRQAVGAREDPPGKTGMAHFVEHLMFQIPSDGPGSQKLMSDIPRHTLFFNAYTSNDETHYMHTGLGDELEQYMKYTALRLDYDCEAVEEAAFLREREVVRNEHRWRSQGFDAFVYEKILELAFPEGHPYRRQQILGDDDVEIASITPDDACAFIERYYTASQATVVVTGNVDPLEVLELAKKYLEPLPKVEAPPRDPVPPPEFSTKKAEIVVPVKTPQAVILYKMPERFSRDYYATQAAMQTMFLAVSFYTSGILEHQRGKSAIKKWSPTGFGGKNAMLFGIELETEKVGHLDQAIDEVLNAIQRGFVPSGKGETYQEYEAARQRARMQILSGVAEIAGRSNAFADYLEEKPAPGFYGAELAALDNLKSEQAQAVGRRVFARENALVVKVVPDGSDDKPKAERAKFDYQPKDEEKLSVPDDIDPAEAHRPVPLEDIVPAEGQALEFVLDNGMRVVLVRSSQIPVMEVQLIVGAGLVDSPEHPELAQLVTRSYGVGGGRGENFASDSQNIMSFFHQAGAASGSRVGALSTTFSAWGLSIYLDFLIAGLSEQVIQSEYQTGALEYWKMQRQDELKKASKRQAAERSNAFFTALYGAGHPHVREMPTSARALRGIRLRELEAFRKAHYRAANSALIMTGGFDMDLAVQYVDAFFGKPKLRDRKSTWQEPRAHDQRPRPPEPRPGSIRVMTEVDKKKAQTDVMIAYPLAEIYGNDHAALAVMAEMIDFRVGAVRHELGASYGVNAYLDRDRPMVAIRGALDSQRSGEAIGAIHAAVQSLRDGEDFDRQFAFARRNILSQMINAQGDPKLLARQLADAVQNGRSYEYFRELASKVARLTPKEVKAQLERVMVDERSVTLIQGPAEGIERILTEHQITRVEKLPDVVHDDD